MNQNQNKLTALPIFFAFLCMGFGDAVGPLVGLAKDTFQLTNFAATLIAFSGFIMFGILSIPLGVYQDKKGKKFILLLGLAIAFIGLLVPIMNGMWGPRVFFDPENNFRFIMLLLSVLLLGAGATILQVAGNPIMRDVSAPGKYSSNLSLGQSIKAIGSSIGFLVPPLVTTWFGLDWSILFPIYAILILVTFIWTRSTPIKEIKDPNSNPASFGSSIKLLGNGYVFMMVFGIFLYVGAEVSMSSQIPILMDEAYGIKDIGLWVSWALFFLPIFLGRLIGSAILRKIEANVFLKITALISIAGILMLLFGEKTIAFAGILLVGFGFANIFPLIFSIAIEKMPSRTNELSGLMVTAIVGGAFIPPLTGFMADQLGIVMGFIVTLACIAYIGWLAFFNTKISAKTA
jgi:fucose permease